MVAPSIGAHSAEVEMELILGDESIRIRQMGPDFLLIDPTREHLPCDGQIHMRIDSHKREWTVRLPKGIAKDSNRVELAKAE